MKLGGSIEAFGVIRKKSLMDSHNAMSSGMIDFGHIPACNLITIRTKVIGKEIEDRS